VVVQLPMHQMLKPGSSASSWASAEVCKHVVDTVMSMSEAGCCEDKKVSGSSSDGGCRQRWDQALRERSRHSWFLRQPVPRIEHDVEQGVHIHSRRHVGGQELVLQPGDTGTVHSASEAEEAASTGAASELVAVHMVQRTDEQGLASTGAVQKQSAVLLGAARQLEEGTQAEGKSGTCHVQMDGETKEQLQETHG
jgi:hypothetical protein